MTERTLAAVVLLAAMIAVALFALYRQRVRSGRARRPFDPFK